MLLVDLESVLPDTETTRQRERANEHDHNQGDGDDEDVSHHGRNGKHLQILEKGERNRQHTVDDSPEPHLTEDGVVAYKTGEQIVPSNLAVRQATLVILHKQPRFRKR